MGALRSVTGPFSNCGNWNSGADFPFYTGPCGACGDCCGDGYWPPAPPPVPSINCANAAASFSASAPVNISAGNAVSLNRSTDPNDAFSVTAEGIRIACPGVYMAIYTVNVPEDTAVSSVFALALNGSRVAASATNVVTTTDSTADSFTMHALVRARAGDLLTLTALSDVSIASAAGVNVFTLTLVRVA